MSHRVIIVGAGIIGAAIAHYLSRGGAEVTVIEQHRPACGATGKSFGWINANFPQQADYFRLRQSSMAEYHRLAAELDKCIGLKWGGSLWWEYADHEFDRHVSRLENYGYPIEQISPHEFHQLEPQILNAPTRSARFPIEGAVDPVACTTAMIDAAKTNGATLLTGCETTGLIVHNNRCVGVKTAFGDFYTDTVVAAVGASAQTFLGNCGITLPMNNSAGLIVHTRPVDSILSHLMITPGIHFRQHLNGAIVIGEDFGGRTVAGGPPGFASELIKCAGEYLPNAPELEIAEITAGARPVPSDGYPVLGAPADVDGLYIAAMHSGVTLAPIIGKIAAQEILSGQPDKRLESFRLSRFS